MLAQCVVCVENYQPSQKPVNGSHDQNLNEQVLDVDKHEQPLQCSEEHQDKIPKEEEKFQQQIQVASQMEYDIENINKSIDTLKKAAPQIFNQHLINKLLSKISNHKVNVGGIETIYPFEWLNHDWSQEMKVNFQQFVESLQPQQRYKPKPTLLQSEQEEQLGPENQSVRTFKKKIVANCFCKKNKSFAEVQNEIFEKQLHLHIGKQEYELLLTSVLEESFYYLSLFIKSLGYQIESMDELKQKVIIKIVSNCRLFFSPQLCYTLFGLVYILFDKQGGQSRLTSSSQQLYKLYQRVIQEMKKQLDYKYGNCRRRQTFLNKSKIEPICIIAEKQRVGVQLKQSTKGVLLDSSWNIEFQQMLIKLYCEGHHLNEICNHFLKKYPQSKHLFKHITIRQQISKILHVAIRKLQLCIKGSGEALPQLVELNDEKIKQIIYANYAQKIRKLLFDIYRKGVYDHKKLVLTINSINQFFQRLKLKSNINQPGQSLDLDLKKSKVHQKLILNPGQNRMGNQVGEDIRDWMQIEFQ